MDRRAKIFTALIVFVLCLQPVVFGQGRERSEIAAMYKWNLSDLYSSDEQWVQAKEALAGRFDEILKYEGKLASSPSRLLECLQLSSEISKELSRLGCYASMKFDEDTRSSKYLAMKQQIEQLGTEYNSQSSFIEPEIAAMDKSTIEEFISREPGLKIYSMYLHDILRRKAHKLSEKEEKIIAEAGLMADGPHSIYMVFSNAEVPYPEVKLSDGRKVVLDKAAYSLHRASSNRSDRELVFQAFWQTFNDFRRTFGAQLYANINRDLFYTRVRKYDSCLGSALDRNNIPVGVYHSLIENVHKNLDSFHRYLKLKQQALGVEKLKYSDLYAPVAEDIDLEYSFDEARELVLEAFRPLGEDYCQTVKQAFEQRWIDVYPTPGKRSGAYSNGGAYDVHPYILLNYNGRYEDVSTLAHELGHTMHSYLSNSKQPYPTAGYSIFVAEVASTLNEALLFEKMMQEIEDDSTRLALLMDYLERLRQTLYRQTQFAEFELRIHERAAKGEPVTGDSLNELYGEILQEYYGHDKGVCYIDELYAAEWAYVPHFYYNFYVYQYATSFTASTALAEKVLEKKEGAVESYIDFLSAGGSDYPIPLLKKAGVDMTTAEPFNYTMEAFNRAMDQAEKLLAKRSR